MDPFSIIANTAGVIDLSVKIIKFIYRTKRGTDTVDENLRQLVDNIERLRDVSELMQKAFSEDLKESEKLPKGDDDAATSIWRTASSTLNDCKAALKRLDTVLDQVRGEEGSSVFDRMRRHFRMLSKDDEFVQLQTRLDKGYQILQMSLTALSIIVTRQSQVGNSQSLADLSAEMVNWQVKLEQLIFTLENTMGETAQMPHEKDGINTAKSVKQLAWLNVHFMVPQPVSTMFMGREPALARLGQALEEFRIGLGTRRVVIYGLGGSGKTQFCCKFAQDNRPSFWGIFFINATNAETVQSSYADIASRAGIEPKEGNVKHWLSEQTKPWLLIVDNVDDHSQTHSPQDFIPESAFGFIIFTTRNHLLRTLGNFAIKFEGLEEERSSILLLTAAGRPQPFAQKTVQTATEVCRKFGFLPLAILHAGRAIMQGTCTLENCLDFVENSLSRVRRIIHDGRSNSIFSALGETTHVPDDSTRTTNATVYATFELVIPAAREEAAQLLQLLSFMYSERFHFQILLKAITNPQRQARADKKPLKAANPSVPQQRPKGKFVRNVVRKVLGYFDSLGDRPALPRVLRSLKNATPQDAEFRLREVLSELRALALLDYIETDDVYCMHSSVNWWIRASMEYQEKAVWCQAACNVLAYAILLPPVGVQDDDAQLRRLTLPHIEYVTKQEGRLRVELEKKQAERERSWPSVEPILKRARILQDAKFSLVYAECGKWLESQKLMLAIDTYLVDAIGLDDPIAARVRLFLSETYWWLGDADEAVRLQEELLAACRLTLGDEHVDTLNIMERLGGSYWQQSRFHVAERHAQKAVDGFRKAYPRGHVDTFRATTTLGRCVGKLADFERAIDLHTEALDGLIQLQRESDSEFGEQILDVQHHLAMARLDRHRFGRRRGDDLDQAAKLQSVVLHEQVKKHGKQHPKALWAACNLAWITASTGALGEAEQMMKWCAHVADRTIGPDHRGTLMGKAFLGQILTRAGKLEEAEDMLTFVIEKHRAHDGDDMHADQLVAAAFLLDCYRRREKHKLAEEMQKTVLTGTRRIFGEGSPWESYFVRTYTTQQAVVVDDVEAEVGAEVGLQAA